MGNRTLKIWEVERRESEKLGKWEKEQMGKKVQYRWELEIYQMSVGAAMQIFEISKGFPKKEIYIHGY